VLGGLGSSGVLYADVIGLIKYLLIHNNKTLEEKSLMSGSIHFHILLLVLRRVL
jgi:hypothetical protein